MDLLTILDLSIKEAETQGTKNDLSQEKYCNYMDEDSWKLFVENMRNRFPSVFAAFSAGSGDELGIKKSIYPPKMACYGSSSRMLYNLISQSRNKYLIENFSFEKKMATKVGGVAHLDGFIKIEHTDFYIEAKCREPYYKNTYIIDDKYKALYDYIDRDESIALHCEIQQLDDRKMKVVFSVGDTKLQSFDLKQMICHLLAIANERLTNPTHNKIKFVYLLFNPHRISIIDPKYSSKIHNKYDREIAECDSIPFQQLFKTVVNYLRFEQNVSTATQQDIEELVNSFSFIRCDQNDFLDNF